MFYCLQFGVWTNSQDWAGQKWQSRGLVTLGCDMMAFLQDHGPDTHLACCSESSWQPKVAPFPAFFTMPCSAPAMMIVPTSMSTSMSPRNTPKTSGSGSHLCHIGKLFLCVFLCAWVPEIREEVAWSVLEAGARGKEMRKGGETMPHSTLQHHAQQFQQTQRTRSKPTCPTGVMRPRQGILACAKF